MTGRARQIAQEEYKRRNTAELRDPRPLMSVADAATYLDVNRNVVYRLINAGELRAVAVGETKKLRPADIDDYLDRRATTPAPVRTDPQLAIELYRLARVLVRLADDLARR